MSVPSPGESIAERAELVGGRAVARAGPRRAQVALTEPRDRTAGGDLQRAGEGRVLVGVVDALGDIGRLGVQQHVLDDLLLGQPARLGRLSFVPRLGGGVVKGEQHELADVALRVDEGRKAAQRAHPLGFRPLGR